MVIFVVTLGALFVIVKVPEVVIGLPLILIPVPAVAATDVTVPVFAVAPVAIPFSLVLSAAVITPAKEVVAAAIVASSPAVFPITTVVALGVEDKSTSEMDVPPEAVWFTPKLKLPGAPSKVVDNQL